jgi:predicted nuclease with TOPRIM domain
MPPPPAPSSSSSSAAPRQGDDALRREVVSLREANKQLKEELERATRSRAELEQLFKLTEKANVRLGDLQRQRDSIEAINARLDAQIRSLNKN